MAKSSKSAVLLTPKKKMEKSIKPPGGDKATKPEIEHKQVSLVDKVVGQM